MKEMKEKKTEPKLTVYCPECMKMIKPGEFAMCPYYQGEQLSGEWSGDISSLVFRCHVKCGCTVTYHYYEKGELKTRTFDIIENEERLRQLLSEMEKESKSPKKRILLVDDDEDFIFLHSSILTKNGYEVSAAFNEEECRKILEQTKPDLVIMDVMMEHLDSGLSLSKEIKTRYPSLPIILLTSLVEETGLKIPSSEKARKELINCEAFINKPVNQENLLAHIRELLTP